MPQIKRSAVPEKKKVTRPKGRRWEHECDVVGLRFRFTESGRRALADMLAKRGSITGIRIVREPENPRDPNAIMVCLPERVLEGAQLGYLRATTAELLAPKLDNGSLVVSTATLEELDESDKWNTGTLLVRFIDVRKSVAKPKR